MKTKSILSAITQWFKQNWWVIAFFILGLYLMQRCQKVIEPVIPSHMIVEHVKDSVIDHRKEDSLLLIIDTLKNEIVKRKASYDVLMWNFKLQKTVIQMLPADEVAKQFSDQVHVDVRMIADPDTGIIVPVQGIKNALVFFLEKEEALLQATFYKEQDSLHVEIINTQQGQIDLKDKRISKLISEFYMSHDTINSLKSEIKKDRKKIKNRNTALIVTGSSTVILLLSLILR